MKKGFTLIELLIVITIIGILAVAFVPQILGAPSKARDTQRITHIQKIASVFTQQSIQGTLPTANACIKDMGLDAADFGGTVPSDPSGSNASTFTLPDALDCTTTYGYIYQPTAAGVDPEYSFGVYALVENFENANAKCSSAFEGTITKPSGPTVDGNGDPVPGTDPSDWCYAILVQ